MSSPKAYSEAVVDGGPKTLEAGVGETSAWKDFLALIKIGIVNSNAITTFTGVWLALHFSGLRFLDNLDIVFLTLIGSSLIIAGSCSLNNYIDRDIDHLMERTKGRPTVTGKVEPVKVMVLGFLLVGIGSLLLFMTTVTAGVIGLIGVFSYVVLYSMWSKRLHVSNTIVGSVSGAVPPLIGWAAVDGNLDVMAWVLFLIMFIWQPPHFYALAMRRAEEYRAANIPMLPVVKGFKKTKQSIVLWVTALLPLPFLLTELGIPFLVLATALNIGWLALGVYARKFKDDIIWAKLMFVYSLQYLTILFVAMVIVTLI
ncbi:protoheme IX farnesyltransferase [Mesobacillus campisalis]|uniref:Protoheme IX farnesyltransferase n=1 Tax=Mesobacillus campisalis TaxID=1408103 RepID=A0A0M2T131_9BACI|nr:heme o synthase [Mesobacillus campisalis]KKK39691.1 protoheme IX farnesyltransferase [Mesobacillus campisalis]